MTGAWNSNCIVPGTLAAYCMTSHFPQSPVDKSWASCLKILNMTVYL